MGSDCLHRQGFVWEVAVIVLEVAVICMGVPAVICTGGAVALYEEGWQ